MTIREVSFGEGKLFSLTVEASIRKEHPVGGKVSFLKPFAPAALN